MALAYTAPTWVNGSGTGISASQLQALSDCMEGLVQGSDKAITNISISGQTITLTFADGSQEAGTASGLKGISSIAKTGTSGNVDTYTITYTDGSTSTFTVTNGTTGPAGPQGPQGEQGPAGDDGVSPEVTITAITGGHRVNITDATHPQGQDFDVMDGHDGASDWDDITNKPNFATVATSGSYNDLSNKPSIPAAQVNSDWNAASGVAQILNKPTIPSITNCYQTTDTEETALANADYVPFYDISASAKRKISWSNIKSVLKSYFDTLYSKVVANPSGTATGTLTKLGIGSDIYNIQGGGGGIDGSTVTPTDIVATWLECAGLHQSYTTLSEVLADSGVLYALINSTNAVDYMVRSTTWASSVCANQTAMNYIGNNNYCADVLLANSTWKNALVNSAYADEVLTVVPATTSSSMGVGASSYYSDTYAPWKAFDQNMPSGNFWGWSPSTSSNQKIWYHFPQKIKVKKFAVYMRSNNGQASGTSTGKLIGSNDGTNWTEISNTITVSTYNTWFYFDSTSDTEYEYIGIDFSSFYTGYAANGVKLQFYGRSDLPPVDDCINEKADKTDIAPVENSTTASRAYAIGQQFYLSDGKLYKCKQSIAQGATFTIGTNCELAPSITDQIKALWDAINS